MSLHIDINWHNFVACKVLWAIRGKNMQIKDIIIHCTDVWMLKFSRHIHLKESINFKIFMNPINAYLISIDKL